MKHKIVNSQTSHTSEEINLIASGETIFNRKNISKMTNYELGLVLAEIAWRIDKK